MMRPEYQKIIDQAERILPKSNAATLRKKLTRWSVHEDIRESFFNRRGEVTAEQKIQALAEEYHYSPANINKIVYLL